jgi:regulatory protein
MSRRRAAGFQGDPGNTDARAADPAAARAAAVALLARRDFASGELRERLTAQGFAPESAVAAVAALTEEGVVDDERYAQNYVAYHAGRGQGPVRIAADLRVRGLPQELIDAALDGGPDWRALAGAARVRRFGRRKRGKPAFCGIVAFQRIISAPPPAPIPTRTEGPWANQLT